MFLPVYLHGPPDAWQIWLTKLVLNFCSLAGSLAVSAKNLLIRVSVAQFLTNSSTTAVIAFFPPRRGNSDFDLISWAEAILRHPAATAAAIATTIKLLRICLYSPSICLITRGSEPQHFENTLNSEPSL